MSVSQQVSMGGEANVVIIDRYQLNPKHFNFEE